MESLFDKYGFVSESDYNSIADPSWPEYTQFVLHQDIPEQVYKDIDEMLLDTQPFSHPSFCVNPFYAREIPKNTSCCLLPEKHNIEEIKQAMLAGERHPDCSLCYNLEDAGHDSDRLIKNRSIDYWLDTDIKDLYERALMSENQETMYKIDTSNSCNSTCLTCNSGASTSWAKLEQQNNIIPLKAWNVDIDHIDVDYLNATMITFRGGEPLLSQTNFAVLEKLIEADNTDCFISFTTNTSVRFTRRQFNILKSFKNLDMCLSIDGVGSVFEYIRYPLKWDDCVENLNWYRQQGFSLSVSYTLSNVNLPYYAETIEWFKNNNLSYLVNPVYGPSWFRPGALSEQVKQKLWKEYPIPELEEYLCNHSAQDDLDWQRAWQEIAKQDQWKNISISDYINYFS